MAMDCTNFEELIAVHALDALDGADRAELEAHLATCANCRLALDAQRDVAGLIGYGAPAMTVPANLKGRLRDRLDAATQTPFAAPAPVVTPIKPRRTWQVAAAVLAVLFAGSAARVGALQHQLAVTQSKNAELVAQLAVAHERMASLGARDVRVVSLASQSTEMPASARLFWSPERKAWLVTIADLPPAGAGKTYQLWAVTPDAKVPMGTFEPDAQGGAVVETKLTHAGQPVAAAVSVEPMGGMPQPTGPIVMVGNL